MKQDTPAVMVTGATGGIGSAIVRALYANNEPAIVAACRHPERIAALTDALRSEYPESQSVIIPHGLDLASFQCVRESSTALMERGIRLRALINNAGTMPLLHHITIDGHETATQVNYLSTILLTRRLLPSITDGGTIIFTVSVTRKLAAPRPDFDAKALSAKSRIAHFMNYARSKSMLSHYAFGLASELLPRGIAVCCVDPGVVDSGIITLGIPTIDKAADRLFRPLIATPAQGAAPAINALKTPITGALYTGKRHIMLPAKWDSDHNHHQTISLTDRIINSLI